MRYYNVKANGPKIFQGNKNKKTIEPCSQTGGPVKNLQA